MVTYVGSMALDPEFFVVRKGSNKATSIHLMEKFKPYKTKEVGNPVRVEAKTDGFALEFTNTPARCRDYISPAYATAIQAFHRSWDDEYHLSPRASMELTKASTRGETPIGVKEYGCVPDINAYDIAEKVAPLEGYVDQTRFIGGHIHQSIIAMPEATAQHPEVYSGIKGQIKASEAAERMAAYALFLDVFIGLPMVAILGKSNDYGEALRRTYYGQAGSHRVKEYGIEYRVLSGMVMSSPFILTWVLGQMKRFTGPTFTGIVSPDGDYHGSVKTLFEKCDLDTVRRIIDTHDVESARSYWKFIQDVEGVKPMLYNVEFVDKMIEADQLGLRIPLDMRVSWATQSSIRNHTYPGVEGLMYASRLVTPHQFPMRGLVEPRKGWSR